MCAREKDLDLDSYPELNKQVDRSGKTRVIGGVEDSTSVVT